MKKNLVQNNPPMKTAVYVFTIRYGCTAKNENADRIFTMQGSHSRTSITTLFSSKSVEMLTPELHRKQ